MEGGLRVQVAQRGVITLPKKLRDTNKVQTGDLFRIIDLGKGAFMMIPYDPRVDALADGIWKKLEDKGETLESMLQAIRDLREKGRVGQKAKTPKTVH